MRQAGGKSLTWRLGIAVESVGVTVSTGSGLCEVPFFLSPWENPGATRGLKAETFPPLPEEASEGWIFYGNGKSGPRAVRAAHTGITFAARTFPEAKAEMAKR